MAQAQVVVVGWLNIDYIASVKRLPTPSQTLKPQSHGPGLGKLPIPTG